MIVALYLIAMIVFVVAMVVANPEDTPFIFFWAIMFFLLTLVIYT